MLPGYSCEQLQPSHLRPLQLLLPLLFPLAVVLVEVCQEWADGVDEYGPHDREEVGGDAGEAVAGAKGQQVVVVL